MLSSETMGDPPETIKYPKHVISPKPIRQSPKHPSHSAKRTKKSLSVSFSQFPPKLHKYNKKNRIRLRCCSCKSCCFYFQYACIIFLGVVFLIVLFAALFVTYIHSKLPEFKVERLTIPRLNISSVALHSYLSADVDLFLDTLNKNEKLAISYGPIEVSVSSGKVGLGQATVPGLFQDTGNFTVLKVHTRVSNSIVDNEDGARLKASYNDKSLVLDVLLTSNMGLDYQGLKLKGLPVVIKCSNFTLSSIADGIENICDSNVFTLWELLR